MGGQGNGITRRMVLLTWNPCEFGAEFFEEVTVSLRQTEGKEIPQSGRYVSGQIKSNIYRSACQAEGRDEPLTGTLALKDGRILRSEACAILASRLWV